MHSFALDVGKIVKLCIEPINPCILIHKPHTAIRFCFLMIYSLYMFDFSLFLTSLAHNSKPVDTKTLYTRRLSLHFWDKNLCLLKVVSISLSLYKRNVLLSLHGHLKLLCIRACLKHTAHFPFRLCTMFRKRLIVGSFSMNMNKAPPMSNKSNSTSRMIVPLLYSFPLIVAGAPSTSR